MQGLDGAHILITGSNGAIGRCIAERFSAAGAILYLHARSWESAPAWLDELAQPPKLLLRADLRDAEEIERMFTEIRQETCSLDGMICNAGMQQQMSIERYDERILDDMYRVNLKAPMVLSSLMAGMARACGTIADRSIVHIASIEAHMPAIEHAHYGAFKAGLVQFMRASALELGGAGIRVNAISPGLTEREGLRELWAEGVERYTSQAPLHCLIQAESIAETAVFLCSPSAKHITGIELPVDAGIGVTTGY